MKRLAIVLFLTCVPLCLCQTGSPTPDTTTDPGTTTPETTTTTIGTTTTTTGPTTTTEPPTTTEEPTTTTTSSPIESWDIQLQYSVAEGDSSLTNQDDGCVESFAVDYDIPFGDGNFRRAYVCVNGLVCFDRPFMGFTVPRNGERLGTSRLYCLAPFMMDFQTTDTGTVWHRHYDMGSSCNLANNPSVVSARNLVRTYYDSTFNPMLVHIVTWDGVWQYDQSKSETSTFQLVFSSDGESSYAFYFYGKDKMNAPNGYALIGQILRGVASGITDNSLDGSYSRKPNLNLKFGDRYGAAAYRYRGIYQNNRARCRKWHACEVPNVPTYLTALRKMPLCPCFLDQGTFDPNFDFSGTQQLFQANLLSDMYSGYSKTCGYMRSRRTFVVGWPFSGSFTKYHPVFNAKKYLSGDLYYKNLCCEQANMCYLYYQVRPEVTSCYFMPRRFRFARLFGDPHFKSVDGLEFTFNGHGEYILLKNTETNVEIQARTEPFIQSSGNVTQATVFTAFVIKGPNVWLQVELNAARTSMEIYAGQNKTTGYYADFSLDYYSQGNAFRQRLTELSLERFNNTLISKFSSAGLMFNVTQGQGLLQLGLAMDGSYEGKIIGLLGNFNGNASDDLIPRNGNTPLAPDSTDETIFNNFGSTWAITSAESNFRYKVGKSTATYSNPDFQAGYYEDISQELKNEAMTVCGANAKRQCIFDYAYTRDRTVATETTSTIDEQSVLDIISANQIPSINVTSGIRVVDGTLYADATVGTPVTLTIEAIDTDTVTVTAPTNTVSAQLTDNGDSTYTATFSLSNTDPVELSLMGTDTHGVNSALLDVTIVACSGCSNQGTCNFTVLQDSTGGDENFELATCQCEPYWEGVNCESDVDGCATDPCLTGQPCTDRPAAEHKATPSLTPYICGNCPTGYQPSVGKCADINECATNPCVGGTCNNTDGSFRCICPSGYRLAADKLTCKDINECVELTHNCDQLCVNTVGSFDCQCRSGYTRNAGDTACELVNAGVCSANPCPNSDGCYDNNGTATCFCKAGYTLQTNNSCTNTNECELGLCSQGCTDSPGSFQCSCYTGYRLDADKVTCNPCPFPTYGTNCASTCNCGIGSSRCDPVRGCICLPGWTGTSCNSDINECENANACSDVNHVCTNSDGSFSCTCRSGYQQLANGTCADIDECEPGGSLNDCEQICTNTLGGFTCGCNAGYVVDATDDTKCKDFDECAARTSGCQQICVNLDGRFNCECNQGFQLNTDRRTCTAVPSEDPCASVTSTKNCSDICTVVNGSAVCQCSAGYTLGADGQNCIDVNECSNDSLNGCSEKDLCTNSAGSYVCSCPDGKKLLNDGRTCTACDEFHWGPNCANLCDCAVGASTCNSTTGCVCLPGWTGTKCDVDKNECDDNVCTTNNEECINTPGSYECRCQTGYEKDGNGNCVNIDECTTIKPCSQICTDTVGSYTCSCNPGFVKSGNECNDIDECANQQHDCQQVCTNTVGSFRCSCQENFQLNTDLKTCSATNPCTSNPCSGSAVCANINGTDTCVCNEGYKYDTGSVTTCVDIKECDSNTTNTCTQKCVEEAGSYSCECDQDGYKLDADGFTCIVCEEGQFGDDCLSSCTCETAINNTKSCNPVNGTCTCWDGWNGTNCQTDIDECETLATPCPSNSACVNSQGSFSCVCSQGYIKAADGTCTECDDTHFGTRCSQVCSCETANTADCHHVTGVCSCRPGWTGGTCQTNINECNTANICNDTLKTCTDTPGSYKCSCISGYTLDVSGKCLDDNECLLGTDSCNGEGQTCVNTDGGFTCDCEAGYSSTGATCTPCTSTTWGYQCTNTCDCNSTYSSNCSTTTGCVCVPGWTGDDCSQDIDECTTGSNPCTANADCTNSAGSYTCTCTAGYKDSSNSCVPCDGNKYGEGCTSTCDCEGANTVNSDQMCDHVTGLCKCKSTWTGDRCQTDVDECANNSTICDDKANQGCHNLNGSHICSCYVGFVQDNNGDCVDAASTTQPTTPPAGEIGIEFSVKLNLSIAESADLTVNATNVEYKTKSKIGFEAYFKAKMTSSRFRRVFIRGVRKGSLIVDATAVITDTTASQQSFSEAVYDLLKGDPVTIGTTPTSTQALTISNQTYTPTTANQQTVTCVAYAEARGPCQSHERCEVNDGVPSCQPVKTSDNFALIIGLGVGIPLFFVAVLVIAIVAIYVMRLRKRSSSRDFDRTTFDRGFFPSALPTKINTYGGADPMYVPYSWDQESSASFSSSSTEANKKRRRKIRGDPYPEPDINYVYDNNAGNHFSWDFLYNYISPNERYEIQRPQFERRKL